MEPVEFKRQKNETRLLFAPNLDISQASGLHAALTKALQRKPPFVLDGSQIERTDTAGMQILAAFCHTVRHQKIEFRWHKPSINLLKSTELLGMHTLLGIEP